jgi:hypothetical protein
MSIRVKGRAKFDYRGRQFVWWVDNDTYLRIASADKQFVVAYLLFDPNFIGPLLAVHGPEFPGVSRKESRPSWFVPPKFSATSMGGHVAEILDWYFQTENHERFAGTPPPACAGRVRDG